MQGASGNGEKEQPRCKKGQEPLTNYATSSLRQKPAHAASMRHGCQLASWHRADWPPQQQPGISSSSFICSFVFLRFFFDSLLRQLLVRAVSCHRPSVRVSLVLLAFPPFFPSLRSSSCYSRISTPTKGIPEALFRTLIWTWSHSRFFEADKISERRRYAKGI